MLVGFLFFMWASIHCDWHWIYFTGQQFFFLFFLNEGIVKNSLFVLIYFALHTHSHGCGIFAPLIEGMWPDMVGGGTR